LIPESSSKGGLMSYIVPTYQIRLIRQYLHLWHGKER